MILEKYVNHQACNANSSQPEEAYHGRKICSRKAAGIDRPLMRLAYFGHASKQRRASTTASGGKPDDKAHQQNAGSG